ncbi:cytochrome c [Roseiarcaceae bacterium H3SJ34-1]|uniref:c-type cytochrome n=1 Tax=Terripilifer ovatus TaxID=3032367 RepID=UPI003AB962CD|nr:cytochrome c [Roseiarcaceae bacterium H3SJ34-1]
MRATTKLFPSSRTSLPSACLAGCLVLLGAPWLSSALAQSPAPGDIVKRGEYLARAADCLPCHTQGKATPYSGGRPFELPFGTIYSANITPDRDTGIGSYSDDEFVSALQSGVGRGGKHLYPAMPYTSYTLLSRDDILAIKAYLFSLTPARAQAPENTLMFPFNQRWGMIAWNLAFHRDARWAPDASKSAEWNRGGYLVEGLGHCGECHTPRTLAQNVDKSQALAGTLTQGWKAYNITSDGQSGIGGWSDDAIAAYLASGHAPGHSSASGPMGEVIENSLRYLTPEDIKSMVVYLRTVAPIRNAPPITTTVSTAPTGAASLGQRLFASECANCHSWDGTGSQSPYADLVGSRTVNDPGGTNLLAVLIEGAQYHFPRETTFMPPFARGHSNDEIAAVANFVSATFGNNTARVSAADVMKARSPAPALIPTWVISSAIAAALVIALLVLWLLVRLFRPARPQATA